MALQGFTHAMVLVTVTACPSIIIKTGGADPLADSTLSREEIISMVVERKVVVNIVSGKTVDQLGQVRHNSGLCHIYAILYVSIDYTIYWPYYLTWILYTDNDYLLCVAGICQVFD